MTNWVHTHDRLSLRACMRTQSVMRVNSACATCTYSWHITQLAHSAYTWARIYKCITRSMVLHILSPHACPAEFTRTTDGVHMHDQDGHACELSWSCVRTQLDVHFTQPAHRAYTWAHIYKCITHSLFVHILSSHA